MEDYRDFEPSRYQVNVARAWSETDCHLIVDAVAGSGKTKTILWLLASHWKEWSLQLGRKPRALLCAFNRSIRDELELRVPPGTASVMTLNSLGHSIVCRYLRAMDLEPDVQKDKLWRAIRHLYPIDDEEQGEAVDYSDTGQVRRLYASLYDEEVPEEIDADGLVELCNLAYVRNAAMRQALARLVNLQRATLSDDNDQLAIDYSVELPWHESFHGQEVLEACADALYPAVARVLEELKKEAQEHGVIDYADQLWLPHVLRLGRGGSSYDAVFVDEAQDLNQAQLDLIMKVSGPHGRLVLVGDPQQAIYAFRGAGIGMIEQIERLLEDTERGVERLPLSCCYRCPRKVIDVVRAGGRVMQIEPAPDAPPGEILFYSESEDWTSELSPGCMVLCRTNAPLAEAYFKLLRCKIAATIRGRGDDGIHKKLIKLLNRSDSQTIEKTIRRAQKTSERKTQVLWAARRFNEAVQVTDLFRTLAVLAGECESTRDLRRQIEEIFSPDQKGIERDKVTLSTIHKAKGLESEDVFVIRPDLLPLMCFAKTPHDIEQEKNLEYVCYTRAKQRLVFVSPRSVQQRHEEIREVFPDIDIEGGEEARPVF